MLHAEMLIAGHFMGGPCDQSFSKSVVRDCWSGSTYATVAEGEWSELDATLDAAREAKVPSRQDRARWLALVAERIRSERQELAEFLVHEIGKPIDLALGEVDRTAITFQLSALEALKNRTVAEDLSYDRRSAHYNAKVDCLPLGTILGFVPYNWPYNLAAHKLGPAIATGNRIVLKPSPLAAFSTMSLVRLVHDCGLETLGRDYDPRLISVWLGDDRDAERAVKDPRVDYLSFTGSARVGWYLRSLVPQLPATLELGGNAASIIRSDAILDHAIERCVVGALAYSGQICISLQRILVHRSLFNEVSERLAQEFRNHSCANPERAGVLVGPMINPQAAQRVSDIAAGAVGRVLVSGSQSANRLDPILVSEPDLKSALWQEEAFGPIAAIVPFEDDADAIALANSAKGAIHASVFGTDLTAAREVANQLRAVGTIINDGPNVRFDSLPYGGIGESGTALEGVPFAANSYLRPVSQVVRKH